MSRSRGRIFYDSGKKCLAYVQTRATPEFWDARWDKQIESDRVKPFPKRGTFVSRATQKHLAPGSHVLEGGCGTAFHSRHLRALGYETTALDFATETIQRLARDLPDVNPMLGNVKSLPFNEGAMDGYWSLGVIEHFYEGYDEILTEMARVLRPGGYAFITFPYMNPLRRLLRRVDYYPPLPADAISEFYQFALDYKSVERDMQALGFTLVEKKPLLGLSGFEDTFPLFQPLFKLLRKKNKLCRGMNFMLSRILEPWTGHMVLLVMKKQAA